MRTLTTKNLRWSAPLLFALCIAMTTPQSALAETLDADAVQKIVQQEIARLLDGDALDAAITRGIENYVRRQQQQAAEQQAAQRQARAKNIRPVDAARDHILGAADAPITIIEYSDFECPFCKRFHPTMLELMENNAKRVRWVYRHFPLASHNPGAQIQAEAVECAAALGGNAAFWQYTDAIYARTTAGGNGFAREKLLPLAAEIGVDTQKFAECLDSGRMTKRVQEDHTNGIAAGVSGTPAVFLLHRNGQIRTLAGAVPLAELQTTVDEFIRQAK